MIRPLPVDWSKELHSTLLGDHLDSLRNDLLPLGLEAQSDPTEFDFGIVALVEEVDLFQFCHLIGTAENNNKIIINIFSSFQLFRDTLSLSRYIKMCRLNEGEESQYKVTNL